MGLQPTAFGKRHRFSVTYDQMIEDADTQQLARFYYLFGYHSVRCARLSHAGRVIMAEDHRRRIIFEYCLHDFARIDAGGIQSSEKKFGKLQHPMLIIQQQQSKNFLGAIA